MELKVEKIFEKGDGKRRVLLVRRPGGNFGLVEEYWYENIFDGKLIAKGWASLGLSKTIYETREIAEREASEHFHWLSDLS
jgi:hypothetical protein